MSRVLIVDDHAEIVTWLCEELTSEGYQTDGCTTAKQALEQVSAKEYDLILSDVEMPGLRGIDLMDEIHRQRPSQLVILMTAFGNVDMAVRAVRAGAADFVTKPFTMEVLLLSMERALRERRMRREIVRLRHSVAESQVDGIVARSQPMRLVVDRATRAARVTSPVLLTGETGVGKGTIARLIHRRSPRAVKPFVQVNCAALPTALIESELFGAKRGAFTDAREDREGLFWRANGGTLFLDEIGELPMEAQPKLLQALETGRIRPLGGLQERTVDVRVIAATNQDLDHHVQTKAFRADLLFRLDVIRINIPPLRERPEDIEALVDTMLNQLSTRAGRHIAGIAVDALAWLQRRPWPGNVRELANTLERAVALGEHDVLTSADLGCSSDSDPKWTNLEEAAVHGRSLEEVENLYIKKVINSCNGNITEAAKKLKIDRRTLYRKIGS